MGFNPVYRIVAVRTAQASVPALLGHLLLHWPLTGLRAVGLWLAVGLSLYFIFVFVGEWTWGLPITVRLPRGEKGVALTFDDGPSSTTSRILDILHEHQACATFFVLGERMAERPDLVRRIAEEGHGLGLHGLSHREMVLPSHTHIKRDIRTALALLQTLAPDAAPGVWLRPPHGFKSLTLPYTVGRLELRMAAWSVNARDYRPVDVACIVDTVLEKIRPGSIVLLHDGPGNGATVEALPLILEGLRVRGLRTVVMPSSRSASLP